MKSILLALMLMAPPAWGDRPGDQGFHGKYCLGEGTARRLMDVIQYRGSAGYRDAIQFGWVNCVDTRLQPSVRPIRATLLERRWKQTDKFGNVMVLWKARAYDGTSGTVYIITRE
ncbi:hypothetical protein P67b_00035 [Ruegeria phage Tedan]|nr:hypothetical protein P67b_00035 [Ruegeria phage Tedan]